MKRVVLVLIIALLSFQSYSQQLKKVEEYIYESHYNDSVFFDTVLNKVQLFNKDGSKLRETNFREHEISHDEQYFGDSLRIVYLQDPIIEGTEGIYYHYDNLGGVEAIITSGDTTRYKNYYEDSLRIKSVCIGGGGYTDHFTYVEGTALLKTCTTYTDRDTLVTTWNYDDKGRLLEWVSGMGNTRITIDYQENPKIETEIWSQVLGGLEYEKLVRFYDMGGDQPIRTDYYRDTELINRRFHRYFYY